MTCANDPNVTTTCDFGDLTSYCTAMFTQDLFMLIAYLFLSSGCVYILITQHIKTGAMRKGEKSEQRELCVLVMLGAFTRSAMFLFSMLRTFRVTDPSDRFADIFNEASLALKDSLYYASYCLVALTLAQSFSLVPKPRGPKQGGYLKKRLGKGNPRKIYLAVIVVFATLRSSRFAAEVWAEKKVVRVALRGLMVGMWSLTLLLSIIMSYKSRKRIMLLRPRNIKAAKLKARMNALIQYLYVAILLTIMFYVAWFVRYALPGDLKDCEPLKWFFAKLPEKLLELLLLLTLFFGLILRVNFVAQRLFCCCYTAPDQIKKSSSLSSTEGSCKAKKMSDEGDASIEDAKAEACNSSVSVKCVELAAKRMSNVPNPGKHQRLHMAKSSEALWHLDRSSNLSSASSARGSDMIASPAPVTPADRVEAGSTKKKQPSVKFIGV